MSVNNTEDADDLEVGDRNEGKADDIETVDVGDTEELEDVAWAEIGGTEGLEDMVEADITVLGEVMVETDDTVELEAVTEVNGMDDGDSNKDDAGESTLDAYCSGKDSEESGGGKCSGESEEEQTKEEAGCCKGYGGDTGEISSQEVVSMYKGHKFICIE